MIDSTAAPAQAGRKDDTAHSYDEAVELTGHGSYSYLLLAACSLINCTVAMDMFGISVVTAAARCDLQLTILTTGLLNSSPMAGIVLFALPWGFYSDRCGRRRALLISTIAGFLFGALSSFSPNWQTMLVLKLVGCSFATASSTLSIAYLGEGIGSLHRCRYLFIMISANLVAELFLYGLAYFILPLKFSVLIPWLGITLRSWRLYNFILTSLIGINALLLFGLYESPKLLASIGKRDEALEVLNKIYRRKMGEKRIIREEAYTQQWSEVKVLSVNPEDLPSSGDSIWMTLVKQMILLFKPPLLWRTLQLFFLLAVCSSTNNVFLMWYPTIVNTFFKSLAGGGGESQSFCERVVSNITTNIQTDNVSPLGYVCDDSISSNTMYAGMLLGLSFGTINLVASTVASYRRMVLIASFLVSGLSLILVNNITQPVANMVTFTLTQITAVGISSANSYFVDLYPTSCRGLVTSLGVVFMRMSSVAGINLVGPLIVLYCSLTFYCWAIYVACGIVVALFLPSDKKRYK